MIDILGAEDEDEPPTPEPEPPKMVEMPDTFKVSFAYETSQRKRHRQARWGTSLFDRSRLKSSLHLAAFSTQVPQKKSKAPRSAKVARRTADNTRSVPVSPTKDTAMQTGSIPQGVSQRMVVLHCCHQVINSTWVSS